MTGSKRPVKRECVDVCMNTFRFMQNEAMYDLNLDNLDCLILGSRCGVSVTIMVSEGVNVSFLL